MDIKRGDVCYAHIGYGVGSEQSGERPVLVIQNDVGNQFSPTVIVAAISKKEYTRFPTHVFLPAVSSGLKYDSIAMLEQVRTIDKQRISDKIARLDTETMDKVSHALMISIGLIEPPQPKRKEETIDV